MSKTKPGNSTNDQISPPHHQGNLITLPNVQGVSEKISRVLRKEGPRVAYKPIQTINKIFSRPKNRLNKEQTRGIVYKYECKDCDFVYYGETGRSLKTRIGEHKDAVRLFDQKSKAAQHANTHNHSFDFENVRIVTRERNYHKRTVLES